MIKTIILGDGFVASHLPYPIVKDRLLPNAKQIGKVLAHTQINTFAFYKYMNNDEKLLYSICGI